MTYYRGSRNCLPVPDHSWSRPCLVKFVLFILSNCMSSLLSFGFFASKRCSVRFYSHLPWRIRVLFVICIYLSILVSNIISISEYVKCHDGLHYWSRNFIFSRSIRVHHHFRVAQSLVVCVLVRFIFLSPSSVHLFNFPCRHVVVSCLTL